MSHDFEAHEHQLGISTFAVGWRNKFGGGTQWPPVATLPAAEEQLAQRQAQYEADPKTHPAHQPVTWYIEQRSTWIRSEIVSEIPAPASPPINTETPRSQS